MPLALTTPKSAGDLDPNASQYAQITILELHVRTNKRPSIEFMVQLGNTVDDNWVPGVSPPMSFELRDAAFQTLVSTHSTLADELTYDAVKRGLYEWLISEGHFAGTIV